MKRQLLVALWLLYGLTSAQAQITGRLKICVGQTSSLAHTGSGTWSSASPGVATIGSASGQVSGVSTGTAVITFDDGSSTETAIVTVNPLVLPDAITGPSVVCIGSSITLQSSISIGATWSSSSTGIATVTPVADNNYAFGKVTGIATGTSTISYILSTGCYRTHNVTVPDVMATPITSAYQFKVCEGSELDVANTTPGGTWSSSNERIGFFPNASVGTIRGYHLDDDPAKEIIISYIATVSTTLRCATHTFTVTPLVRVTYVTKVCIGNTITFVPDSAGGTWSSTEPDVLSINSSGVATGLSAGATQITYQLPNRPNCSINLASTSPSIIVAAPPAITGTLAICEGTTSALAAGSEAGTWSSSNAEVATIGSASGMLTGISAGTAIITFSESNNVVCTSTAIATVNALPVAAQSYEAAVCTTGTLRLYANDIGSNTYAWSGPSSFTSTAQNPTRASATTAMSGTYSLTVTSATTGCAATYTVAVTVHTGSPYTVSVTQIAPFTLYGERVHTYGTGVTLRADPSLSLASPTYTWAGDITASTATVAPTFTSTTTVTIKTYSVTVAYNGCSASVRDTMVVPSTGCTPYNYFSVNNYRSSKSLSGLGSCSDCNDVKPFHTINTWNLSSANIVDGENYYLASGQPMFLYKSEYANNNFFLAPDSRLYVDTGYSVALNHCHFASPCTWVGIIVRQGVTTTGHIKAYNNTLIEDAYGTSHEGVSRAGIIVWKTPGTGGYYATGMQDVLESDGVIYNKNAGGINIQDYRPSITDRPGGSKLPFTIKNSIFSRVEFARNDAGTTAADNYPFAWPTAAQLKVVVGGNTLGSGVTAPKYALDNYRTVSLTCGGINLNNVGNKNLLSSGTSDIPATYEYSYIHIGADASDVAYDSTNLFDSLHSAVSCNYSNLKLFNNSFKNITNMGVQGIGTYNDLRLEGDTATRTNNRFYNCSQCIRIDGASATDLWDFTCTNTLFATAAGVPGMIGVSGAYFGNLTGSHGYYNMNHNYLYNHSIAHINNSSSGVNKGITNFCNNLIVGKTSWYGPDSAKYAIYINDYAGSSTKGVIRIDTNTITGTTFGIWGINVLQSLYINYNNITIFPYNNPEGNVITGIDMYIAPGLKEIKYNTLTGQGYKCYSSSGPYSTGMRLRAIGNSTTSTDVTCNLVQDIGYMFNFIGTSYVNWRTNEMRRGYIGLMLDPSTSIGDQGSTCDPSDNTWTGTGCSSGCSHCYDFISWNTGSGSYMTYTAGMTPTTSKLYVRPGAPYEPTNNGNSGGGAAYIATGGSPTIVTVNVTSCGTPGYSSCIVDQTAERGIARNSEEQLPALAIGTMTIFPNPAQNGVTIEISDAADATAEVKIVNTLGAEVYNGTHTFSSNRIGLNLQHLAPGMYIVHLHSSKGTVNTGRIVIVK